MNTYKHLVIEFLNIAWLNLPSTWLAPMIKLEIVTPSSTMKTGRPPSPVSQETPLSNSALRKSLLLEITDSTARWTFPTRVGILRVWPAAKATDAAAMREGVNFILLDGEIVVGLSCRVEEIGTEGCCALSERNDGLNSSASSHEVP